MASWGHPTTLRERLMYIAATYTVFKFYTQTLLICVYAPARESDIADYI